MPPLSERSHTWFGRVLASIDSERERGLSRRSEAYEATAYRALEGYGIALLVSLGVTLAVMPLLSHLDHANTVMLFLLAVVGVAAWRGRGPAVLAAVCNVLAFNFVFVPPHFAFSFETLQSILTFTVMLLVGLTVGQLTARFRQQAEIALAGEERAHQLYEMARELSGASAVEQIIAISERGIEADFRVKARLLLPDDRDRLQLSPRRPDEPAIVASVGQWCFERNEPAGLGAAAWPEAASLYLPVKGPSRARGVLVVTPDRPQQAPNPEQRRLLDTVAALIAIALERVHFAAAAQRARLKMEAERERNALLAGFSHDLRTPMTALLGMTETMKLELSAERSPHQDTLAAIREHALRMALLVDNLLDMAKLQAAGGARLRKDWQSLEELVGSAVRALEQPLAGHPLELALDPDLPLINCDAVLIERVLVNLLQNAAKYTPPETPIGVRARAEPERLRVEVWDRGPGLPDDRERDLFEKFTRGRHESAVPGVGLGLSICRAIIEAHGGQIAAETRQEGGACFSFLLPLERLPPLDMDEESDLEPI